MGTDKKIIELILERGIKNIIPNKKTLNKRLQSGNKLNVYFGIDPTATKIHIGHAVPLRKLQLFVELGHNVTFLIGDFTALIGDTSDKESERPILTKEEIGNNFITYKDQASKMLDFSKVKIVHNSEWLSKLTFEEILKLVQHFSVGDFVNRDLIRKRLNSGKRVRLNEALYPAIQGYDSYHLNTDIQLGAADQTFNMQAGRTLQKDFRKKESFVLVTSYLMGTDGRKMSKSWGNAIWIEDDPDTMFGKVMSLSDNLIEQYFTLATSIPTEEVQNKVKMAKSGPLNVKKELAFQIVMELHSQKDARKAQNHFEKTFQKKAPSYDQKVKLKDNLLKTISQVVDSKSEAKRLIAQGAVDINHKTMTDPTLNVKVGDKIKVGSRIFLKVEN